MVDGHEGRSFGSELLRSVWEMSCTTLPTSPSRTRRAAAIGGIVDSPMPSIVLASELNTAINAVATRGGEPAASSVPTVRSLTASVALMLGRRND